MNDPKLFLSTYYKFLQLKLEQHFNLLSLMKTVQLSFHINYIIVIYMQFLWHENEHASVKLILFFLF